MMLIPVPPPIDERKAVVARTRRDRYMNRG